MGPPPIVSGVSPREGPPGTKITIRGENLGISPQDLTGVFINGCDCLLISEWKTDRKIIAMAPAKEGKGDIIGEVGGPHTHTMCVLPPDVAEPPAASSWAPCMW